MPSCLQPVVISSDRSCQTAAWRCVRILPGPAFRELDGRFQLWPVSTASQPSQVPTCAGRADTSRQRAAYAAWAALGDRSSNPTVVVHRSDHILHAVSSAHHPHRAAVRSQAAHTNHERCHMQGANYVVYVLSSTCIPSPWQSACKQHDRSGWWRRLSSKFREVTRVESRPLPEPLPEGHVLVRHAWAGMLGIARWLDAGMHMRGAERSLERRVLSMLLVVVTLMTSVASKLPQLRPNTAGHLPVAVLHCLLGVCRCERIRHQLHIWPLLWYQGGHQAAAFSCWIRGCGRCGCSWAWRVR